MKLTTAFDNRTTIRLLIDDIVTRLHARCDTTEFMAIRRRARRITLTVPREVLDEAATLTAEIRSTADEAVVRLAEEGAAARRRRRRIEKIADARRAAVARAARGPAAEFPPADALRDAMLSGRREDDRS